MDLKNGYKVIYEIAADSKRTFYASKLDSEKVPGGVDPEHDTVLAYFDDADFAGKTIYEYKGKFYKSTGSIPAYDENGIPTDEEITGFEEVFVEKTEESEEPEESGEEDPVEPTAEEPGNEPDAPVADPVEE